MITPTPALTPRPVEYPSEDDVAESVLHLLLRTVLLALVQRWLAMRGIEAFAGSDQFIYWVPGDPQSALAPDLYVLFGVEPDRRFKSWRVWEEDGVAPRLAVEIVSDDVSKDYLLGPPKYQRLGVDEFIVFDPEAESSPERVRWQVYRRHEGRLRLEVRSDTDRVFSEVLDCFLRLEQGLIRLGTGPGGDDLLPTADEAVQAERARRLEVEAELAALKRTLGKS